MSRNFPIHDEHGAPAAARPMLAQSRRDFGFVPAPLARYATSPLMLKTTLMNLEAFEGSSLAPLEREVLALTLGHENGCGLCVALHRKRLKALGAPAAVANALAQPGPLPDERLEALRQFILNALARRGAVDGPLFEAFLARGFTHEQALDVILGVGVYTLTTFANRLVEASEA